MTESESPRSACSSPNCGPLCPRDAVSRRTFLTVGAGTLVSLSVAGQAAAAPPQVRARTVPSAATAKALADRGNPTEYTGAALPRIGMPVGGGTTGQVFLAGDGRLWAWDIFNPAAFPLGGANFAGSNYANPLSADRPGAQQFQQGFALRTTGGGRTHTRPLDATGFDDVRFTGQYPIGRVSYADGDSPVEVTLEAFSPFAPLATLDSTLPATIMAFTVRNTSSATVRCTLLGYAENPACLHSRRQQPTRLRAGSFGGGLEFTAVDEPPAEHDIAFEEWASDTYDGWTVTGDAFGSGPVRPTTVPDLMKRFGDLNVSGTRFVTSYNFRSGGNDSSRGRLTSKTFAISRRYVSVAVGGGDHPGETCVNVVVDGVVVASATGSNSEPLVARMLDVGAYAGRTARIEIVDAHSGGWGHVNCGAIVFTDRADILFEDWESGTYSGWTVTGTAFGTGPVTVAETPEAFRRPFGLRTDLNVSGTRFVSSYNFRAGGAPDSYQGMLTSRTFTISRRFVTAWVGGGHHAAETCLRVLVNGIVVASAAGTDIEPLSAISMDVSRWSGQTAQIQIVDAHSGAWGHVNVDRIMFSDRPIRRQPVAERTDGGSYALAALESSVVVRPSVADWSTTDAVFDSPAGPSEVPGAFDRQVGAVSVPFSLAPGQSRTVRFVLGWFFPIPDREVFGALIGSSTLRRHYATRFSSAHAVVALVSSNAARLESQTRAWVKTWYEDSSLPHWFLERTFATTSTLATSTCHRWADGRFYAWEGTYCCHGTCQHVWSYAQAIGRLFPDLERDTRERVDLGISLQASGEMANRGETPDAATSFVDGQCGTILRMYREHQMSPDASFLNRVWPKVRTAVEFVVRNRDGADEDGIMRGSQWNTLDTEWFGEISWLSGLYVAALHAAAAMATDVGDTTSATRYSTIARRGTAFIDQQLWNAQFGYYVHNVDPARPSVNTNNGSFIDQMYGQTYAAQLGLPRVFPADKARTALGNLYRWNFSADPPSHRPPGIRPGRVYAMNGEPGVLMVTWPHGGSDRSGGLPYFNEVWTGQEYQFAAHLFAERMTAEGLAVTRAVYDRYHGTKRNPYNEVEASDHYARAMMSYGTYLAACGYEYHGPAGHLGFAPRIEPADFRCAFTAAEGWGLYRQTRATGRQTGQVEVRYGSVRLSTLAFETAVPATGATVRLDGQPREATLTATGNRVVVALATPVVVTAGKTLEVTLTV